MISLPYGTELRRAGWLALCASLVFAPGTARAQGAGQAAQAQVLFDEGRRLMDAGRYGEACPKLEASQKLDPGAGTLLNLGACYEKNGQTASAWVTYGDAAEASMQSGHPDWAAKARAKAKALEPSLVRLSVVVTAPVQGQSVTRDGVPVSEGAWGTPLPVDPGPHVIEATAPGKTKWRSTVEARSGSLEVKVPMLADDAPATKDAPAARSGGPGPTMRIVGLTTAGVGLVGVTVGVVLGVVAGGQRDGAYQDGQCVNLPDGKTACTSAGKARIDEAWATSAGATFALVAGGILVAGGLVTFFLAPKSKTAPTVGFVGPGGSAGVTLGGAF